MAANEHQKFFMKSKLLIILCLASMLLGNASISRAADDSSIGTITDVILVRPGWFVATAIGTAFFIVALPVAAVSGSVKQTADTLVVAPAQATFTRPLGDYTSLE